MSPRVCSPGLGPLEQGDERGVEQLLPALGDTEPRRRGPAVSPRTHVTRQPSLPGASRSRSASPPARSSSAMSESIGCGPSLGGTPHAVSDSATTSSVTATASQHARARPHDDAPGISTTKHAPPLVGVLVPAGAAVRQHVVAHEREPQPGPARWTRDSAPTSRARSARRPPPGPRAPRPVRRRRPRAAPRRRRCSTRHADATPPPCTSAFCTRLAITRLIRRLSACTRVSPLTAEHVRSTLQLEHRRESARSTTGCVAASSGSWSRARSSRSSSSSANRAMSTTSRSTASLGDRGQLSAPRLQHRRARRHGRQRAAQLVADVGGELARHAGSAWPASRPSR